ncbi:MAG: YegS/Rv2252/BmrU family lipid kinase [Oscillospiraceae bacterium]|nr:YegS/Rv2252/BmrU family lipid kinase [Oscillospiraceae bacterium]
MKHLFIINPAAGSYNRTEEASAIIHKICRARNLNYEIRVSTAPGEGARIAREACETGENLRIYACGGDGTLNEIVAGAAGYENAAVTVFSGGSGNDFVKLFDDPKAFFDLHRLMDADTADFDLIDCNGDISLNICSVGLDARIGTDVSRYKRLPMLHGFRAYAASTVVNVVKGIAEHYVVEVNGKRFDEEFTFICVCNGRFYGGGFNPVPEADPSDGLLDVLLVKKISRAQVPGIIGKYKNGQYAQLPHVVTHLKTDAIRIICDGPTPINLDGELRTGQVVDMKVSEKKVRFFYPKGLHWKANAECKMQNAK